MDAADIKSPVLPDKVGNEVELTIQKCAIVGDDRDADLCDPLAVLRLNFRRRAVKPTAKTLNNAFDDLAFILQRCNRVKIDLNYQDTRNHRA